MSQEMSSAFAGQSIKMESRVIEPPIETVDEAERADQRATSPKWRSILDRPAFSFIPLTWEAIYYLSLLAVALVMRFWDLGTRAMHHDESLHAIYSWYLYVGRGYTHDPMMHGPFQFHLISLLYFLFGASDASARALAAIFGTALVALPLFAKHYLGRTGAMVVAFMLAFSPSLLYYSRFARNEAYIAFFTLALAFCLFRYARDTDGVAGRAKYLYIAALMISLSFASKEVAFIHMVIFGFFLFLVTAPEWFRVVTGRLRISNISPLAVGFLIIVTLSAPQFSAGAKLIEEVIHLHLAQPLAIPGIRTLGELLGGLVVFSMIAASAAVGMAWNRAVWLRCAAMFYVPYILLYTTMLTNPQGFVSGIWGSLSYWLDQHEVQRGGQPVYYYMILLPIYEFLPIVFGMIAAGFYLLKRRTVFHTFVIFWFLAALAGYSIAGEKMPWLVVHITLPLVVLAGSFIGSWLDRIDWRALRAASAIWLVPLLPLFGLGLLALRRAVFPESGDAHPLHVVFVGLAIVAIIAVISQLIARLSARQILNVAGLGLGVILLGFTLRAGWTATYLHGDIPVEMLVYTQTSPDIPKILADIEELGRRTGEGRNIRITVDATESFTWPWAWYLRDFKNVDFPALSNISGPPQGSVLLLHSSNVSRARPYLTKYGTGQHFRLRWWFPEDYRGLTFTQFLGHLVDPKSWDVWWRYFMYRETVNPLGASTGIAYFPRQIGAMTVGIPAQPVPEIDLSTRQVNLQPIQVIGRQGAGAGELNSPKAAVYDAAGNLFVLDSLNGRVVKFNSAGAFVTSWGAKGSEPGQFETNFGGAWGIAVGNGGSVYVVDTWNHRIQKFDADGALQAVWGDGLTDVRGQTQASLGRFYGPRGIAVDDVGNLYIADTGNHRIQKLSPDGQPVAAIGERGDAPGLFNEPTDVAIDGQGNLYVADAWNQRIQVFDRNLVFVREIQVPGWESEHLFHKPGLVVDPAGNIITTDPEVGRVFRFSQTGQIISVIGNIGAAPGEFNLPLGVAVDGEGNFVVVEAGNHRLQKFAVLR